MSKDDIDITHSKIEMASYGFGNFFNEFFTLAFGSLVFFFYETEVGLNIWLVSIGYIIFAVWNAINDPLVGYLTNRPNKFTKKWGRRFPWIMVGGFLYSFCYILIFMPPKVSNASNSLIIFGWLVLTTCLFDTFASIYYVNFSSLFPDKFRSTEERRTATGLQIPIGIIGIFLGAIIPPLIIQYDNLDSYVLQGIVVFFVTISALMLAIPGFREDQESIDKYLEQTEKEKERVPFIETFKRLMKQRSFVAFVFLYLMYQVLTISMSASIPYVVKYVLKKDASATTLIFAGFLIGALISIPFWIKILKKFDDHKKVISLAGLLLGLFTMPLIFLESYILIIIAMVIWGLALGGFWVMLAPVLADVIDDSIVTSEIREEGVVTGIQRFFGRLAILIQALSFALAHTLTGFMEGEQNQSALAIWGIHVHLAVVPMICIFIGTLVFWKFYDLIPERIEENQLKLKEIGI